jgi:hypothetical protein
LGPTKVRLPTVVIPFETGCRTDKCQDIFLYLRPETNGIRVESVMMRAISSRAQYKDKVKIVYLANLPGDFIAKHRIIEEHYRLKLLFTKRGKQLFTPYMKREFSRYFNVSFEDAEIYGAFEAMKLLGYDREELFRLWVPKQDIFHINGQTIKRYGEVFIINYDIPGILNKNSDATDVAVMILRTTFGPQELHTMIMDIVEEMRKEDILDNSKGYSRVFHYSKGPFEQILDALGFLYDSDGTHIPLFQIHFYSYLLDRGLDGKEIERILQYPIFRFANGKTRPYEETIYAATFEKDYDTAFEVLRSTKAQVIIG